MDNSKVVTVRSSSRAIKRLSLTGLHGSGVHYKRQVRAGSTRLARRPSQVLFLLLLFSFNKNWKKRPQNPPSAYPYRLIARVHFTPNLLPNP